MQDVLQHPVYVVTDPSNKPCAVTFSDNAARAWVRNTVVDHHGTGAMFIGIYRSELGNLTLVYNTDDDIEVVYTIWKL